MIFIENKRNYTRYYNEHFKFHREDGPAVKTAEGYCAWWYNGKCIGISTEGFTQKKCEQWLRLKAFQ